MSNITTINQTQNSYSNFNSYEEYMKQATDPQLIAEMVEKYGNYKNYQKAIKANEKKFRRINRKVKVKWFLTHTLLKFIVATVIVSVLGYIFFYIMISRNLECSCRREPGIVL